MKKAKLIQTYEWAKLNVGTNGFTKNHVNALLKLNELHGFNYLDATSKGVSFRNYVGIIQVDSLTIEILPKTDSGRTETDWRDMLIHMLKVAKKVPVYDKGEAFVGRRDLHLLEIYLVMFLDELSYLLKRGLIKAYRKETSNTLALKGKLELATHLTKNIVHKERFYTTHQVYDHNVLLHQIILFALNIVKQISKNSDLRSKANRLALLFPEIQEVAINQDHFNKLKLNRKTTYYSKIIEISKVIIGNYSPNISSGRNKMLALLFNMDYLWEEYIFQSLRKQQDQYGYRVSRESMPLFTTEAYSLKPDIILRKGDEIYVLDAKWKRPKEFKANQQDLRQIYTYCRFWKAKQGVLIYPESTKRAPKDLCYADSESVITCRLAFLPLERIRIDEILS